MLFALRGDVSLGYRSLKTVHSSSYRRNDDVESYEEEGLEVSLGKKSSGNSYIEIIHSSSSNSRGHESRGHRYLETRHSTSSNFGRSGFR